MNRPFDISFEDNADRTVHTKYFLTKVEIKYYNVMIDERDFLDQSIRNDIKTYVIWIYENVRKIAAGQEDNYTTSWLPNHLHF